jgi:hypothetical protein
MCFSGSTSSRPVTQQPQQSQYTAPVVQQPAYVAPPPIPPVPPAPTPYLDQQASDAAVKSETQSSNLSKARVGRAALKINLVNAGGDGSSSGINSAN